MKTKFQKDDLCQSCIGWEWECPSKGEGFIKPRGSGKNGVLIVGEAAGEDESLAGYPFMGKAGFSLEKVLTRGGLKSDDFTIYNVLACRPPFNKLSGAWYMQEVINHCRPHLDSVIDRVRPKCIVALGDVAFKRLVPDVFIGITKARGYVFWSEQYQTWVVPTIHPAFALRGKTAFFQVILHDIQRAVHIASSGFSYSVPDYTLDPSPYEALRWVEEFEAYYESHPDLYLSCDIETPHKDADEEELDLEDGADYTILRCGYSYRDLHALSIPWDGPYRQIHERLLRSICQKVFWNGSYDRPRIESQSILIGGDVHDAMDAWHCLNSDLRKGLGFVTPFFCPDQKMWKHLSSAEPALYNAIDADVAGRNMRGTIDLLKKNGLFKIYQEFIVELDPVYAAMTRAGVPVDMERRIESSKHLVARRADTLAAIESCIPGEIKNLSPKQGYVRPPADTTGLVEVVFNGISKTYCPSCGLQSPKKSHFASRQRVLCSICHHKWSSRHATKKDTVCSAGGPVEVESNLCVGQSPIIELEGEKRWARVEPFVPSPPGILRYQKFHKHPIIFVGKGGDKKPTTNEDAIKKLINKYPNDPFYPLCLENTELKTIGGRYLGWWNEETQSIEGGMPMGRDKRIHGIFRHTPSTLRSSMVSPNLQNIPRGDDSEIQALVKQIFVAPDGFLFVEADFKGLEAVLVGREAGDKDYIRIAKKDVHSYFAAHQLYRNGKIQVIDIPDLKWSDSDLDASLRAIKKRFPLERQDGKACIHSGNYHIGPKELQKAHPHTFKTIKDAARALAIYYEVFPSIPKWHERLCLQVDKSAIIRNSFGHAHRFYNVLNWEHRDKEWTWNYGDDSKRLISFCPQSDGAFVGKAAGKRLYYDYMDTMAQWLRLFIHDSWFTETPKDRVEEAAFILKAEMGKPVPELTLDPSWGFGDCLSIDVDIKVGKSWDKMEAMA